MSKKLIILPILLILAFGGLIDANFGSLDGPTRLPYDAGPAEQPARDVKGPCAWQYYYNSIDYFWSVPDANPVEGYATRFTATSGGPETLLTVNAMIYNNEDGLFGNNNVYITVYDDDGTGLPGTQLAQVTLAPGTYNAFPTWTVVDFAPLNIVVTGDFHVSYSTDGGPTDDEKILSDDGSIGHNRTCGYYGGSWYTFLDLFGTDYNFVIEVYLCESSGWQPGDDHKMHFPQLPDEDGWDVNATYPIILADDWECSESGYVKDVHFWGSWLHDYTGIIDSFVLSIHSDVPAGVTPPGIFYNTGDCNQDGIPLTVADMVLLIRYISSTPPPRKFYSQYDINGDCVIDEADAQLYNDYFVYGISVFPQYPIPTCRDAADYSRPDSTLWEEVITDFAITPIDPPTSEGWFDPSTGDYIEDDHWSYFQYDVILPQNQWFYQNQGTVYWLNICAFVPESDTAVWGWKSSEDHWNDDAVWARWGDLSWKDIFEPEGYPYRPGDIDHDGDVDIADLQYLADFYYGTGPVPPYEINGFYPAADVDGDCVITLADVVYLANYLQSGGAPPFYCVTYAPDAKYNDFNATFDASGNLTGGSGTDFYGEGWYYYPEYFWWNIWFYDHPYDPDREKVIRVIVDMVPQEPTLPATIQFAVNWSTDAWSLDNPGIEHPPLPGVNEDLYIGRETLFNIDFEDSLHYEFDLVLPYYNPEWVSIDIIAQNAIISGSIKHACLQSLDLAFVITGDQEGPPPLHEGDISLHNTDDYIPPDGDPIGTQWHELWPNYCENWTLTSWFDNGDNKLSFCDYVDFTNNDTQEWRKFHVEWVGPTITVTHNSDDWYLDYICNEYADLQPITDPIGTYWHEVWPTFCNTYLITGWEDNGNGYLDSCDYINIVDWNSGESFDVHVEGIETDVILKEIVPDPPDPLPDGTNYHNLDDFHIPDGNPIGTVWHELYPEYCRIWNLTSWFDNGNGYLDSCDYVDFTDPQTEEWKKFHVEWVGPTVIIERLGPFYDTVYVDMIGKQGLDFMWDEVTDPVGKYWHEVYPVYCQNYFCVGWEDNGNGYLDFCDYLIFQNLQTGEFEQVHVIGVDIDIILDEVIPPDPLPEGINLHSLTDYVPPDENVIGTEWQELHPEYDAFWEITSWIDNGDGHISVCDTIDFNGNDTKYHVEWIGPTIRVENMQQQVSFWDYTGMADPPWGSNFEVRGSYWHTIYPPQSYCHDLVFMDWTDNGNGYLDSCDYIVVQDLVTGQYDTYHVLGLKTDIIIKETEGPCDCIPGDATGNGSHNILDITHLINYLYKGGLPPTPYPLCSGDANCDCQINILDVTYLINYLYKGGNPPCTCEEWLARCGPPLRK